MVAIPSLAGGLRQPGSDPQQRHPQGGQRGGGSAPLLALASLHAGNSCTLTPLLRTYPSLVQSS